MTKEEDGETRALRTLKKGDLLGEVALFRNAPHSATAMAAEAVELIVIPADQLEQMVLARPGLALALIKELARMAAGDIGPERQKGPPAWHPPPPLNCCIFPLAFQGEGRGEGGRDGD